MFRFRILWILFNILAIHSISQAQPDTSDKKGNLYFNIGAGPIFYTYKDVLVSPNTYTTVGIHPGLELGYEKDFPNYHGQTSLYTGLQYLNDAPGRRYGTITSQMLMAEFNTSRCWELKKIMRERITWQLGYNVTVGYSHELNIKFQNSQYVFGLWTNAGIANRFAYSFDIKGEKQLWFIHFRKPDYPFEINWQLNVPLVGAITRPNYAGILHFANGDFAQDFIRMMKDNANFTAFHNFQSVHSQIAFQAPLGNSNQLKIAYVWEGIHYGNNLTSLSESYGGVLVSLMFKMDSHPSIRSQRK
ncbi:MAG: hypothetical protein H0W62_02935 [Chitinophagales bacterium]|nr:hypothetical protein [Chitinophagales bacterium]